MFKLSLEIVSKKLEDVIPSLETAVEDIKKMKKIASLSEPFVDIKGVLNEKIIEVELDVRELIENVENEFELAQVGRDILEKYGVDIKKTARKIRSGKELEKEDMIFEQVVCQSIFSFIEDKKVDVIISRQTTEEEEDDDFILLDDEDE